MFSQRLLLLVSISLTIFQQVANSQVIPDPSLKTEVTTNNSLTEISGGRRAESNLFHSFDEFSIDSNSQVVFGTPTGVQNIFSRVTGSDISRLDGILSTSQPTNLFFLNPNGIIFGDSIQLNIGGSFLASTSSSIVFDDDTEFTSTTTNQDISPGNLDLIRFSGSSGSILVEGRGNNLDRDSITGLAIGAGMSSSGIRILNGQDLILLADTIEFNGGLVTNVSGNITIGSVDTGDIQFLGFNTSPSIGNIDLSGVEKFSDINLRNRALIDASGFDNSEINLFGNNLNVTDGSLVLIQSEGPFAKGTINVEFQDTVELIGVNDNPDLPSNVSPLRNSSGLTGSSVFSQGVDIFVKAANLTLTDAGIIASTVSFGGFGGNIDVSVTDATTITGDVLPDPVASFSTIFVTGNLEGVIGGINLSTGSLFLDRHGTIQSTNFSEAQARDINIHVREDTTVGGLGVTGVRSTISSNAFRGGQSASINFKSGNLSLFDGSTILSGSLSSGDGGDVIVDVEDTILLSGFTFDSSGNVTPSGIGTLANVTSDEEIARFGLPSAPSGGVGNTTITSNTLILEDQALISTGNEGSGGTGDLFINTKNLSSDQSFIQSFATTGNAGDIRIEVSDLLLLTNSSNLSAESLGLGSGGNVLVNSDLVILDSGSSIVANSTDARGGNIIVFATGIFISPDSETSASSDLGESFSGTIDFNTPNVDLLRGATSIETPPEIPEIAVVCNSSGEKGELTVAGSAGLPIASQDYTESRLKFYEQGKVEGKPLMITDPVTGEDEKFERFVGWAINPDGRTLRLVSDPNEAIQFQAAKTACLNDAQPA